VVGEQQIQLTSINIVIAGIRGAIDQKGIRLAQVESDLSAHLNTVDLISEHSTAASRQEIPHPQDENKEEDQGDNEE